MLIIIMMVEVEIMRLAVAGWLVGVGVGWLVGWLDGWLVDWLAHMSKSGRSLVRRSSYFRMNWDLVNGHYHHNFYPLGHAHQILSVSDV